MSLSIASVQNHIDWFSHLAESHRNSVERYTRQLREAEEVVAMWQEVMKQLEDNEPKQ